MVVVLLSLVMQKQRASKQTRKHLENQAHAGEKLTDLIHGKGLG